MKHGIMWRNYNLYTCWYSLFIIVRYLPFILHYLSLRFISLLHYTIYYYALSPFYTTIFISTLYLSCYTTIFIIKLYLPFTLHYLSVRFISLVTLHYLSYKLIAYNYCFFVVIVNTSHMETPHQELQTYVHTLTYLHDVNITVSIVSVYLLFICNIL